MRPQKSYKIVSNHASHHIITTNLKLLSLVITNLQLLNQMVLV
jgi:hypothetical protein